MIPTFCRAALVEQRLSRG